MNKLLYIVKHVLLIILLIFMTIALKKAELPGLGVLIFIGLTVFYVLILIIDFIKKSKINYNNKYNLISVLVISLITAILLRYLYDPHIIYNNKEIIKEISEYSIKIYGEMPNYSFSEAGNFYLMQNLIYFNVLYVLLFIYRDINLKEK